MSTQISLNLSDKMYDAAKKFANTKGYENLQDFIRETIREKVFEKNDENIGGLYTYKASERSLARTWLADEEDKAWQHLQKEK